MRFFLIIIGVILFINGAFMAVVSNFNLGVILTVAFGLLLLLWGLFYKKINKVSKTGALKVIKYIAIALICVEAV